jgi:hypothetical protein
MVGAERSQLRYLLAVPQPALNDPDPHSWSTTYVARQITRIRFFRSGSGSRLDNLCVMTELRPGPAVVLRT